MGVNVSALRQLYGSAAVAPLPRRAGTRIAASRLGAILSLAEVAPFLRVVARDSEGVNLPAFKIGGHAVSARVDLGRLEQCENGARRLSRQHRGQE